MNNLVITVGREFGSGGRTVAKLVAEYFHINCYDKSILELAAQKTGLNAGFIKHYDEKAVSRLGLLTGQSFYLPSNYVKADVHAEVYYSQFNVIRELAAKEPCIIVGRVGNYILRNEPNMVSVFVSANEEDRIKRVMGYENISEAQAKKSIVKHDKDRSRYYNFFSETKWGEAKSYDICVNTSKLGIEGAAKIIETYIERYIEAAGIDLTAVKNEG